MRLEKRLTCPGPRAGISDMIGMDLKVAQVPLFVMPWVQHVLKSLEAAVDEVASTHCQRFARYIR